MKQSYSMFLACMLLMTGCLGGVDDSDTEIVLYEGDEPGECSDGADNDKDGLFDCDDDQCAGSPVCKSTEDETTDVEENQESDDQSTENNNTVDQDENGNETLYIPGLDYGTGWDTNDLAYNLNFTDSNNDKFELYEIQTDFVMITVTSSWDGTASDIFNWMSTDDDWQNVIGNLTHIVVLLENDNGEEPDSEDLKEAQSEFGNDHIFARNAITMDGENVFTSLDGMLIILMEKNDSGNFLIDSESVNDLEFFEYVLEKLNDNVDSESPSETDLTRDFTFTECYIHVDFNNGIGAVTDLSTPIELPEWCNSDGPSPLNFSDFIEISGLNETIRSNNSFDSACCLNESVKDGLWVFVGTQSQDYTEDQEYWAYVNYSSKYGIIVFTTQQCAFEDIDITNLTLDGVKFCGYTGDDRNADNLTKVVFNDKFACKLIAHESKFEPEYCERYEIIEDNGNLVLIASIVNFDYISSEEWNEYFG